MKHTEFVLVYRTEHGDQMHIPKEVQEKYPNKFKLVVEEVKVEIPEVAKIEEIPVKKGTRKK